MDLNVPQRLSTVVLYPLIQCCSTIRPVQQIHLVQTEGIYTNTYDSCTVEL